MGARMNGHCHAFGKESDFVLAGRIQRFTREPEIDCGQK